MDLKPSSVISGWTCSNGVVQFPVSSVPELSEAEADGQTGDIRKVLMALLDVVATWYAGLSASDRPSKMVVSRSMFDESGGTGGTTLTETYTVAFKTQILTREVADE